jgi:Domain of unknown function (DUF4440)
MKKHLLAAGMLLAFASVCFAQPAAQATPSPSPKPKPAMSKAQMLKALSTAEKKLWDAFKNKDPKPFKAGLTADAFALSENGIEKKEDTVKMIASAPCEIKSYELSDWKLTMINSSTALVTYKGKTDGTCAGQAIPTAWCSTLYGNRGGKWLAVFHTETPAK